VKSQVFGGVFEKTGGFTFLRSKQGSAFLKAHGFKDLPAFIDFTKRLIVFF
jgi:hypothetical protein